MDAPAAAPHANTADATETHNDGQEEEDVNAHDRAPLTPRTLVLGKRTDMPSDDLETASLSCAKWIRTTSLRDPHNNAMLNCCNDFSHNPKWRKAHLLCCYLREATATGYGIWHFSGYLTWDDPWPPSYRDLHFRCVKTLPIEARLWQCRIGANGSVRIHKRIVDLDKEITPGPDHSDRRILRSLSHIMVGVIDASIPTHITFPPHRGILIHCKLYLESPTLVSRTSTWNNPVLYLCFHAIYDPDAKIRDVRHDLIQFIQNTIDRGQFIDESQQIEAWSRTRRFLKAFCACSDADEFDDLQLYCEVCFGWVQPIWQDVITTTAIDTNAMDMCTLRQHSIGQGDILVLAYRRQCEGRGVKLPPSSPRESYVSQHSVRTLEGHYERLWIDGHVDIPVTFGPVGEDEIAAEAASTPSVPTTTTTTTTTTITADITTGTPLSPSLSPSLSPPCQSISWALSPEVAPARSIFERTLPWKHNLCSQTPPPPHVSGLKLLEDAVSMEIVGRHARGKEIIKYTPETLEAPDNESAAVDQLGPTILGNLLGASWTQEVFGDQQPYSWLCPETPGIQRPSSSGALNTAVPVPEPHTQPQTEPGVRPSPREGASLERDSGSDPSRTTEPCDNDTQQRRSECQECATLKRKYDDMTRRWEQSQTDLESVNTAFGRAVSEHREKEAEWKSTERSIEVTWRFALDNAYKCREQMREARDRETRMRQLLEEMMARPPSPPPVPPAPVGPMPIDEWASAAALPERPIDDLDQMRATLKCLRQEIDILLLAKAREAQSLSTAATSSVANDALQKLLCIVCWAADRDTVLMPCRHYICCGTCAAKVQKCPTCRLPIQQRDLLYT